MRPRRFHVHFDENMIKYICVNEVKGYTFVPLASMTKNTKCTNAYSTSVPGNRAIERRTTETEGTTMPQMSFPSIL